jgi:hypothetical protein
LHKIIKIEVTKHQKTIEDFIKDLSYKIDDLEKEIKSVKNKNEILETDNKINKDNYQKLVEENKLMKEDMISLRDSVSKLILKFDTLASEKPPVVLNPPVLPQPPVVLNPPVLPQPPVGFNQPVLQQPPQNLLLNNQPSFTLPTQTPTFSLQKPSENMNQDPPLLNTFSDLLNKSSGFTFQKK